jgi:hypothetical protein
MVTIWVPQVAVIASREPLRHLFLLLGPVVHHVTKPRNSFRSVPPKVSVNAWVGDAFLEAVNDVFLRNIRNGGMHLEKQHV